MKSKKLLITGAFGACFKNLFINEQFMDSLSANFSKILIVTPVKDEVVSKAFNFGKYPNVDFKYIPEKTSLLQIIASQLAVFSYNIHIKSNSFAIRQKDGVLLPSQKLLLAVARSIGSIIGYKRTYLFFDQLRLKKSIDQELDKTFDEFKPDILFSASSSFRYDFSAIASAKLRSIPIVGMVFSWDNLSTKGPIYRGFKRVIVWNKFQRDEILPYYTYGENQIIMAGIPQLDYFLNNIDKLCHEKLAKQLKLQKGQKLITYATGSPVIVPHESEIINDILDRLEKTKLNYRFHIRSHPRDNIEEYVQFKNRKNVTLESSSREMIKTTDGLFFDKDDVLHYGELLKFSDVILNVSSTVGLEGVVMNTPVINIGYDDKPFYKSVRRYLEFDHMRMLDSLNSYKTARSLDELMKHLIAYLKDRSIDEEKRISAATIINHNNDGHSGERIAKAIIEEAYETN